MMPKVRLGRTPVPEGCPETVVHVRQCQNVACRVDTYLAVDGHVAMLSCPSCPVAGIPVKVSGNPGG